MGEVACCPFRLYAIMPDGTEIRGRYSTLDEAKMASDGARYQSIALETPISIGALMDAMKGDRDV
jgi:hypothetical protein